MYWLFPVRVAEAATADEVIGKINDAIVNPAIKLLFAVALIVFLWGVVEMLTNKDDAEKLATGRKHMFWGVIGLVIMVSAIGIVNIIISFLGEVGQ